MSIRLYALLTLAVLCCCNPVPAVDYHVAPTGSDESGDGSEGQPFASPSHAATVATARGDRILLAAGDYDLDTWVRLQPGVSLLGADADDPNATLLRPTTAMPQVHGQWLKKSAVVFATNNVSWQSVQEGEQTVANLAIDVGDHADYGVFFIGLDHVRFLRVHVTDAKESGLLNTSYWHDPGNWNEDRFAEGNEIAWCRVVSSAQDATGNGNNSHNLEVRGWRGGSVHHNTVIDLDNGDRGGMGIGGNFVDNIKVHDNHIRTGNDNPVWKGTFNFEFRDLANNVEIYNNDMNNCVSIVGDGHLSGGHTRAVYFHNNIIDAREEHEVQMIEAVCDHAEYAYNTFYGGGMMVLISNKSDNHLENDVRDISVHHNLHIGGAGVVSAFSDGPSNDIRIYNNTILDMTNKDNEWQVATTGFFLNGPCTDWVIANNVISGFTNVLGSGTSLFNVQSGTTLSNFRFSNNLAGGYDQLRITSMSQPITMNDNLLDAAADFLATGNQPDPYYRPQADGNLVDAGTLTDLPTDADTTIGALPALNRPPEPAVRRLSTSVAPDVDAYQPTIDGEAAPEAADDQSIWNDLDPDADYRINFLPVLGADG